jgi:hypothetical protein
MSFLKRLLGNQPPTVGRAYNVNYFTRIRDDASLHVVGEAYRQDLVALARAPQDGDLPEGLPPPPPGLFKAMLAQQPENPYDRNAIMVALWAGHSWAMSGYLSRDDAAAYQPVFRHLATVADSAAPPAIACDAALVSERGGTGVVVHLGTPGECAAELATEEREPAEHEWIGMPISITGTGVTTVLGVPLDRPGQVMLARWGRCDPLPRLSKAAKVLVVADPGEVTSNLRRASEYGIPTIPEPDFLVTVGIDSAAVGRGTTRWAQG